MAPNTNTFGGCGQLYPVRIKSDLTNSQLYLLHVFSIQRFRYD